MKEAIYAGSFDPITNGHVDIIKRSSKVFDKIYVVITENPNKNYTFTTEEKIEFIKQSVAEYDGKVVVDVHSGLIADYCEKKGIYILIRGLRAITDFDYEFQMTNVNRKLHKDIESVLFIASNEYSYISSMGVRELAYFGGNVSKMVPKVVEKALVSKYKGEK